MSWRSKHDSKIVRQDHRSASMSSPARSTAQHSAAASREEPTSPNPPTHSARSESFDRDHEPFRDDLDLHLQSGEVSGPIRFMNPTRATFRYTANHARPDAALETDAYEMEQLESRRADEIAEDISSDKVTVDFEWTSRDNRKGRHAIKIREGRERANPYDTQAAATGSRSILLGIRRMLTIFTWHDVSYLVAVTFTFACLVLVINALLVFTPYTDSHMRSSTKLYEAEAVLGAFGCTLFLVASVCAFSEAVNANRKGCFGWKLVHMSHTRPYSSDPETTESHMTLLVPDGSCSHHHDSHKIVKGHPQNWSVEVSHQRAKSSRPDDSRFRTRQPWIWLPSWKEVRTHLRYDYGFVCATTLAVCSLIYCSMAWAALATIFQSGQVAPWIRIPQLIAALGFAASCTLSMIETQRGWWRPSLGVLGWYANAFNVAGSVGFVLTAVFGYLQAKEGWAEYQFGCCYLWGSLAFLIGSMLQWYEALDKYPVERVSTTDQ